MVHIQIRQLSFERAHVGDNCEQRKALLKGCVLVVSSDIAQISLEHASLAFLEKGTRCVPFLLAPIEVTEIILKSMVTRQ